MAAQRRARQGRETARPPGRAATRRPQPGRPADLPRRTAYDVLAAVRDATRTPTCCCRGCWPSGRLTGRDAALATELTYGTLRGLGTYDAVLAACSDRPLDKLDPPVLTVLRLGAHQLLATRVGAHAAVATSVDLVKAVAGPRVSGYVNAVLRRVATRDLDEWLAIVAPARRVRPGRLPGGPVQLPAVDRRRLPRAWTPVAADPCRPRGPGELAGGALPRATSALGSRWPRSPAGPARDEVCRPRRRAGRWSPYGFTLPAATRRP